MTHLTIPGPLGLDLAAMYHQPATPGPYPLVIMLHGFSGWKEEEHIASLASQLEQAGIAALHFDAPGSGESGGTWAEHYRVSNYLAAVTSVYDYALTELAIDPARVGIWGHSMGGMVALTAASRRPGTFVAVCGSQPSSGKKILTAEEDATWRATGWSSFHNRHFGQFRLPYAYVADRLPYDVLSDIKQLKASLLLVAGTTDQLVSAASVKAIYEAAPEPKRYLEYPIGHDYKRHPEALAHINDDTVAFFRRHLLASHEQ